jgi:orsellinic acid C2-O-methyltransferase
MTNPDTAPTLDSDAPAETGKLRRLLGGYIVTQILATAVRLGVLDRLSGGPLSADELSTATGLRTAELRRYLRALEGLELLDRDAQVYRLTATGRLLVRGEGLLFGHALLSGGEYYDAWADLDYAVRTGESAFDRRFGCSLWERFGSTPETANCFAQMMRQNTASVGTELALAYRFPSDGVVADLGTGEGSLLAELLVQNPRLRGIAFEQASMLPHVRATLEQRGVLPRCTLMAGNLLESVPQGADVYILKSVIHNWKDEAALRMLRTCRASMAPGSHLLLIERAVNDQAEAASDLLNTAIQDLTMLVLFGAHDRTVEDYRALVERAGLEVQQVQALRPHLTLIAAIAAA